MAIGTDALIEFFGTQDDLSNTTSAVSNDAFSDGTNDLSAWTNDDDAPEAEFVFKGQFPSGTLDANPHFNLYARLIDIDGTDDTEVPDANNLANHICTFNWPVDQGATTDAVVKATGRLPNVETSQVYHFYLENKSGVSLSASWSLKVTPKTVGPHA
jgi:hypothetical protein